MMRYVQFVVLGVLLSLTAGGGAMAAPINCGSFMAYDKQDLMKIDAAKGSNCIARGWDPPANWRPENGEGYLPYNAVNSNVQAPESPPGARGAKASVSRDVIKKTCGFPPRVQTPIALLTSLANKLTSSAMSQLSQSVGIPPGTCLDFIANLYMDKNGATNSSPPTAPISASTACPAESDTTGDYGERQTISAIGTLAPTCGGMMPLSASNIALNANADSMVATEDGSFNLWLYRRVGASWVPVLDGVALPRYLCKPVMLSESSDITYVKSMDLTPPVAQMITYNPGVGYISLRLQSRATMDANFIPAYDETQPERYLIIPVDGTGTPKLPAAGECPDESTYSSTILMRQDIFAHSDELTSSCSGLNYGPTVQNHYEKTCSAGKLVGTSCQDDSGAVVGKIIYKDHWVNWCPADASHPDGYEAINGACPGTDAMKTLLANSSQQGCAQGKLSGGTCVDDAGNSIGAPITITGGSCPAASDSSCDLTTIYPSGSCSNKVQFGVIGRPTLYVLPGSSAKIESITGRTAFMATTNGPSTLYMPSQSIFDLQPSAPPITFNEGGTVYQPDGSVLIMNGLAVINPSSRIVVMPKGGNLVSATGIQQATFNDNDGYRLIGSGMISVKAGRSVLIPPGYTFPTMPQIGTQSPYIRLPADRIQD